MTQIIMYVHFPYVWVISAFVSFSNYFNLNIKTIIWFLLWSSYLKTVLHITIYHFFLTAVKSGINIGKSSCPRIIANARSKYRIKARSFYSMFLLSSNGNIRFDWAGLQNVSYTPFIYKHKRYLFYEPSKTERLRQKIQVYYLIIKKSWAVGMKWEVKMILVSNRIFNTIIARGDDKNAFICFMHSRVKAIA